MQKTPAWCQKCNILEQELTPDRDPEYIIFTKTSAEFPLNTFIDLAEDTHIFPCVCLWTVINQAEFGKL